MFRVLLLLFIIVPIIEISVLMQVGAVLGVIPTIAIVIVTAWLGAKNVRQQGMHTLQTVQTKMAQGEMPSDEIITGLLLLVAGVLLVTPGFVTDTFGLLLLVPAFRNGLKATVAKQLSVNAMHTHNFSAGAGFHQPNHHHETDVSANAEDHTAMPSQKGRTLEGEYERKD